MFRIKLIVTFVLIFVKVTLRLSIVLIVFVLNIVRANLYYFIFIVLFYFPFKLGPIRAHARQAHFDKFVSHHARPTYIKTQQRQPCPRPARFGPSLAKQHNSPEDMPTCMRDVPNCLPMCYITFQLLHQACLLTRFSRSSCPIFCQLLHAC